MKASMSSGHAQRPVPRPTSLKAPPAVPKPSVKPAERPTKHSDPPRGALDPSVLVIGADETFLPALRLALTRHRVHVETAPVAQAVEAAVVAAPDLLLLAGEAARDSGHELLTKLTSSPVSSVIPVAILGDDSALDARLKAFRHGASAVIPRTASIDAVAEVIARLARDIPERGGDALGEVGEATLEEFVGALTRELRSGILTVTPGEEQTPVRLVLGGGRPLAAFIDEFVARVRSHVVQAEPLRYEFDDRAGGTIQILPDETPEPEPRGNVSALRLLLADDDPARADIVAQELRSRGAEVFVSALNPSDVELSRLRGFDPEVVIVGERELEGQAYSLLRRMKRDTRLRWTSLLVVRWEASRDPAQLVPTVERLTTPLAQLAEADRGLCDRAELGDAFDARLEVVGPARCLRALAASGRSLRVTIQNPRVLAEVDLSDKLLVGATATGAAGERWEGAQALAALLVISSGRVRVEPSTQPATTNLMAPVDAALDLAEREAVPIAPSLPAQAGPSEPPKATAPGPGAPLIPRAASPGAWPDALQAAANPPAVPAANPAPARWKPKGIKGSVVAVLVAIAAVQGLLYAGVVRWFRERGEAVPASSASVATPSPSVTANAERSALPARSAAPAVAAVAAVAPSAAPPAPTPTASAADAGGAPLVDESGTRAPRCEDLWGKDLPNVGDYPGAAYEQLRLARKALVAGRADDAQRGYCTAIRWDSKNPIYYFELAQLLLVRRDGAAAAAAAKDGVRLEPTSTKGQSIIGDGLARIGDFEGAKTAWYAAANVNNPSTVEIAVLTVRSLTEAEQAMTARDFARAERFFRRGVVLDEASVPARRGLANALLRLNEAKNALVWAKAAALLSPKDPMVQTTLGEALLANGDKQGARAAWTEADLLGYPDAKRRLERLDRP